jgi:hypothetical protein
MITMQQALTANEFVSTMWRTMRGDRLLDSDTKPTVRCRRNGATKTWKKYPGLFRIPVKAGLKTCFYIQNFNDSDLAAPAPGGKALQSRNDDEWAIPAHWAAERALFEGVRDAGVKP